LPKTTLSDPGKKIRVAVLGATGYAGVELIRFLLQHPRVDLTLVTSQQHVGKRVSDLYPGLAGKCDMVLEDIRAEKIAAETDVAFTALPHETSTAVVASLVEQGERVIDLSADFRLHDAELYRHWYREHQRPEFLSKAVYGLAEIHRTKIAKASLIANPGCYPTGAVLGLAPLFTRKMVQGIVVIDAKSGVTGAGRSSTVELSFSEVNENFKAYNVGVHRHTPEIEQELSEIADEPVTILFAPHLLPINRGILSTMYVDLKKTPADGEIEQIYHEFYGKDRFVRILSTGRFPETKDVRGSNDCAIGFRYDPRAKRLIVITAIDNLVKGAAGQAVQNLNLMCGWAESDGLQATALIP
jgi:N-acetyl-gamma-glutamyl-phosphate reductase